jgi:hypothetical protein
MTADLILVNARLHSMDPARPRAEALAAKDGRILAIGDSAAIAALAGRGTRRIDAGGRLVLPGLQDPHVHLLDGGTDALASAPLAACTTTDDIAAAIAAHAARYRGPLVLAAGWKSGFFGDANLTRQVLDRAVPDRPVLAYDENYHNACLNSAALALAGIDRATPDPLNGHIVRDAAGEATGMLHEEAIPWARARLPELPPETFVEGAREGQRLAFAHGITGIIDPWIDERRRAGYAALEAAGGLTIRVSGAAVVRADEPPAAAVARLSAWRAAHRGAFRVNAAKVFLDGGLENRTAAMLAPYADAAGGNAPLMFTPAQIAALFPALDAARFQIHVHAIGDAAARAALDGFAAARAANGDWPGLHQIAHVQVVAPEDRPRFAALGVMANAQPLWAGWDPAVPDATMAMVGPARLAHVYAFRALLDAGAPFCAGSDWPVTTLNPFEIIETAVTRQTPAHRGPRGEPFLPAERLTVAEAVQAYTTGAAAACWRAATTGMLAPGRSADLVVLDRDLFAVPPQEIGAARALLTLLAGTEVHRAADFDG